MQFFLTVPHDSAEEPTMASMDPAELEAALAAVEEFNTALHESGAFRFAGGLHPPSSAKTVDATDGEPVVIDGPFVEAPEYVGGFWVIEAADQDAAVRWATRASKALGPHRGACLSGPAGRVIENAPPPSAATPDPAATSAGADGCWSGGRARRRR
jgi:hypothetical protein